MNSLLEHWQQSIGPIGYAASLVSAGMVVGLLSGLALALKRVMPQGISDIPPPDSKEKIIPIALVTPRDKRRNPRRLGGSVEIFVALPGETSNPVKGVVLNRSVGGLGILVGDAYPVGTTMCVRPLAASEMTPWVEVGVRTCRKRGGDWEVGVQFQKLPPYATMVQFG